MSSDDVVIESRIHLFGALSEAAELEHNLMCLYLYALFSLKRSPTEGVSEKELEAIERWRKVILSVCLEEMTHLSLVANLVSSIGGAPNFMRPNFPVAAGYYPSGLVQELAPFTMETLDHFIYLERPQNYEVNDGQSFAPSVDYHRRPPRGRLMPNAGDYKTVGDLYEAIRNAFIHLCHDLGEKQLFCGNSDRQITPADSPLPGFISVHDKASALKAIETIVTQGEGATTIENSHFDKFCKIKTEYEALLKENPNFTPGRNVARNPVMREPIIKENRVWVTHPLSAEYMDLANSFYGAMLRMLTQVYLVEDRDKVEKHEILEISFTFMHIMAVIGETLTLIPATEDNPTLFAGMSFAMVRTLNPLAKQNEFDIMLERAGEIDRVLNKMQQEIASMACPQKPSLNHCIDRLEHVIQEMRKTRDKMNRLVGRRNNMAPAKTDKSDRPQDLPQSDEVLETAESDKIKISFCAHKCIHSRHCVTEMIQTFKPNTPGKWLYPENTAPESLAAVIKECPSGALTYKSKTELEDEKAPPVNVIRLYENGPYAFLADLEVDGKPEGYRATLCRCGQSKRKPFCDHTHKAVGFLATGEPETTDATELKSRDGKVKIDRVGDGPLSVSGNLEICTGTGRVVLRTENVRLCRCGHSKNKPVCDSTHSIIGFKDSV